MFCEKEEKEEDTENRKQQILAIRNQRNRPNEADFWLGRVCELRSIARIAAQWMSSVILIPTARRA